MKLLRHITIMFLAATLAASTAFAQGAPEESLPESLTRAQIITVVKQGSNQVATCRPAGSTEGGTVTVSMVIENTGVVSNAKIASGPLKGTQVGMCVEQVVGKFKFPRFSGPAMRVNMPFGL